MKKEKKKQQEELVYPKFEPFYSKQELSDNEVAHHGLFDSSTENYQVSHGKAPWDEYGFSRDGWGI